MNNCPRCHGLMVQICIVIDTCQESGWKCLICCHQSRPDGSYTPVPTRPKQLEIPPKGHLTHRLSEETRWRMRLASAGRLKNLRKKVGLAHRRGYWL